MLVRASARYLLQHPWLLLLSLVGVALGVAVVVSVDLANASATRAFAASTENVAGRATHQVVGASGSVEGDLYVRLRQAGVRESAPVAEGNVTARGRVMTLLGLDPLADAPFRSFTTGGVDLALFLATPRTVFLSPDAAARLGVGPGDTLGVEREGQQYALQVAALIDPGDEGASRSMENLLLVDVATAQAVLGLGSRLTRIDLMMGDERAGLAPVEALLPPGARLQRPAARTESLETMTRAFRLNLAALSFLALVVGMFLVYNTTTFSVVQRRPLLGRLRAIGVTRREVFGLVLGEALAVGVIGTALGLLLGIVLGRGLVDLVAQTINDLYVSVAVRPDAIPAWTLVKGALLGIGATFVAALVPAREAAQTEVLAVLRRSESEAAIRRRLPRLSLAGGGLMVAGGLVLLLPVASLTLSYLALLAVLLGFALVVPLLVTGFARVVRPLARGPIAQMAVGGLQANLSRVAVAVAALSVAVAATIGVGVMIGSFRETVVVWLEGALQADVYAQPPSLVARRGDASLTPEVVAALRSTPGARASYTIRSVETQSQFGLTQLVAISGGDVQEASFRLKSGRPKAVWPRVRSGEAVLVSEPFAFRNAIGVGDSLRLATDRGEVALPVAGVYFDYGSDAGLVLVYRNLFETLFEDRGVSGVALYAAEGVSSDSLVERARMQVAGAQSVILRTNRGLREYSLAIFDRTFTITSVLRLLALIVAFVGVLSALMALQLERARELATLRAQGLTRAELWRLVTTQTGLMGLVAGLLSVPLGLFLAAVLVYVINRRSFGWTLQFSLSPGILVGAVVLALVAALLAGLYPSWKMAQANPAQALREE